MGFGLTQPLTSNSLLSPGTKPGVTLASSPGQTAPGKQMTVLQSVTAKQSAGLKPFV